MPKIIEFVTFRIMIKRQSLCKVFVILMLSWGAIDMMAADQFVLFQPSSDALQLKNLTVGAQLCPDCCPESSLGFREGNW